jgi:hypothetical protein
MSTLRTNMFKIRFNIDEIFVEISINICVEFSTINKVERCALPL